MVKRIRGVTFSARVSSQFENSMIHAARGIFNRLLPDVHIFTDHKAGPQAGKYDVFHSVDNIDYLICILEMYREDLSFITELYIFTNRLFSGTAHLDMEFRWLRRLLLVASSLQILLFLVRGLKRLLTS